MEIIFSNEFKKDYKKIKDETLRFRILKALKKIENCSEAGKPLHYALRGHRSVRIPPFRIIYRLENNKIIINCFEHRDKVYG